MISFPNAKINLGLQVTRKRDDGFHDIETVFCPVPLCDALEINPSGESKSSLYLYGTPIPGGADNLCMKAYDLIQQEYGLPSVNMHLLKRIPAGAGLGGGSSDAAHTLLMLNELFNLKITPAELEKLAARLGSDCAFFIRNKPTYAHGRSELFEAVDLDLSGKHIMLVKPDIHINTAEAYGLVKPNAERPSLREITQQALSDWKDFLINDFEKPIFEKYPEIQEIKELLYQMGALYASMSGSGSAVYGFFGQAPSIPSKIRKYFHWEAIL